VLLINVGIVAAAITPIITSVIRISASVNARLCRGGGRTGSFLMIIHLFLSSFVIARAFARRIQPFLFLQK